MVKTHLVLACGSLVDIIIMCIRIIYVKLTNILDYLLKFWGIWRCLLLRSTTVYAITLNCYKNTTIKQFVLEMNRIPSQLYHHKKTASGWKATTKWVTGQMQWSPFSRGTRILWFRLSDIHPSQIAWEWKVRSLRLHKTCFPQAIHWWTNHKKQVWFQEKK